MRPQLIFGCGGAWGASWFDQHRARGLLDACVDAGIDRFDTGPTYGPDGLAEKRLGAFLADHAQHDFAVSTKVGSHRNPKGKLFKDYSAKAMRLSLEASLTRLGTDSVDLVLLHGPLRSSELTEELIDAIEGLRDAGLTRQIGASCDADVAAKLVKSQAFDVLMTTYNYFDTANHTTMEAAAAAGMSVIVKAPLAHGVAGFPRRPLWRRTNGWYNARLMARRPKLIAAAWRHRHDVPTSAMMLGFVRAHRAVDAIVIGTTSRDHLLANARALAATPGSSGSTGRPSG